jgi:catechol 2,3-dioxygenase-like lactoylglutathione lyase family enzyme
VKFYCDVLGFKVSDWRSDFFAFLRCSRDHHTINLLQADNANIHHLAFELRDEAEINRACDFLARKDIKLFWGPIRHLIGHNIAIYHKNPDGITVEFFTDLDQMHDEELGYFEPRPWHQDRPQRPKVWGDDTPTNYWGPGHPARHARAEEIGQRTRNRRLGARPRCNPFAIPVQAPQARSLCHVGG